MVTLSPSPHALLEPGNYIIKAWNLGASLVAQWIRIHLPTQWTGLIPGPGGFHMLQGNYTCEPQLLKPVCLQQEKPPQWEAHPLQRRGATAQLKPEEDREQQERMEVRNAVNDAVPHHYHLRIYGSWGNSKSCI